MLLFIVDGLSLWMVGSPVARRTDSPAPRTVAPVVVGRARVCCCICFVDVVFCVSA